MTKNANHRCPLLASFARGYLHQDMPEEHGSLSAALRNFRGEMSAKEHEAFQQELEIVSTESAGLKECNALLTDLGSSWQFLTEQEVQAFLTAARK